MKLQQFEVRKSKLSETRVVSRSLTPTADGEILCKVDRFAFTANNITYGVVGEKIGYWQFFPTDDGWGIIPVWGFADVIESKHPEVKTGERLYGYFPMATHLLIRPDKVRSERLIDGIPHRSRLPPVYNSYARTGAESYYDAAMDNERMLLFPLYATSFCLFDFLQDKDYFGASQIIVTSASSKTAIGLAYALNDGGRQSVGLTSSRNKAKVLKLGLYDSVVTYDQLGSIDNDMATVIVDMSGDGPMLSNLHAHLGDNMRFTSNVGMTHYDANEMGPHFIRDRSAMFFAPGHIQKRARDWGPGEFETKAMTFWYDASIKSREWLSFDHHRGMDALTTVYRQVLAGKASPDQGIIVTV